MSILLNNATVELATLFYIELKTKLTMGLNGYYHVVLCDMD